MLGAVDASALPSPRGALVDWDALPRSRFDELCDLTLSQPLDRTRPLWRVHLAPALDDGSVGLVMKAHHAMVDGKSAVELALLLLDLDPGAASPSSSAWASRSGPLIASSASRRASPGSPYAAEPGSPRRALARPSEGMLRPAPLDVVEDRPALERRA